MSDPVLPDTWCPGLPPAERIARLLLDQQRPELCYHLDDPDEVRASLSRVWPGHVLPDVIVERGQLLEERTALVHTALGYLIDSTGLAIAALEAR